MKRFAPLLFALTFATLALAQTDSGRFTRHEFVPELGSDEGSLLVSSGGAQPEAIVYQGDVLPAPEGGALRNDEQPMDASPGDGEQVEEPGRRSRSFSPDRTTNLDGEIGYYPVFTPTINPFKRVTAYDTVVMDGETPILTIGSDARVRVEAIGAGAEPTDGPRDRFWGNVVLSFRAGDTVPFPSVAPNARILTISTEPETFLRIERDGADNFYATRSDRRADEVRVIFLTDAPRAYFGAPLPAVALETLAPIELPPEVQRDAEIFLAELGLSRRSRFDEAMEVLAAWFRAFEESDEGAPNTAAGIYLDLARGRRGICRHRAYAFVISAQALGIRARFVHNEAHAWVEVELPGRGWLRVDLGGAATGLETRGENGPAYDPGVRDSLPRPEPYERAVEQARQMNGTGQGRDPNAISGSGEPGEGAQPAPPVITEDPTSRRVPLQLVVDRRGYEVFRGRELEVTGTARGSGDTSDLRVEVVLRAQEGVLEWTLGVTVTQESGRFRGVFGVPPTLPVGEYRLVVRSPGNDRFAPAQAI